ncbi:MAG TPA: hypothetical protein VE913_18510 [Longimicrobium sp.]|nr:hypothetical protein [Longimicrobium sp.]
MRKSLGHTVTLAGAALALVASAPAARAQQLPPARQILERHMEAIGGRQVLGQQRFRRIIGDISMPAMGITMTMDARFARPNKFVMRTETPGMGTMFVGFDGTNAWSLNSTTGPQMMEGKELQQALREADFDGSMDPIKSFPTLETTELANVDGKACHRVRMVTARSDTVFGCFDVGTGLMSSMDMKRASPMGEMAIQMRMLEYRDFGGTKMATRTTVSVGGQEMMVTTVKSVSYEPIAESEFIPPAEIRALIQNRPAAPRN